MGYTVSFVLPGLTHVVDLLPEGLGPALHVFRCRRGQHVGHALALVLRADVYTLAMDRTSV